MNSIKLFWLSVLSIGMVACSDGKSGKSPDEEDYKRLKLPGYENSGPSIVYLPETLGEISGIVYYAKDSSIICIVDNEGVLYKYFLYRDKALQSWPFSDGEDFEEIVLHDSTFFAVQSNGTITNLRAKPSGLVKSTYTSPTKIDEREFEGAIYDSVNNYLLLVCKDCEDDSTDITSVWGYDIANDRMLSQPVFRIDHLAIEKLVGKKIEKFKPSAAGVHPITGDYYYISAINDLLVVTDRAGVVKSTSAIDKKLFKQPEGLSFTPNGDLVISNEFADIGRATLLLYKYQPTKTP